MCVRVWRQVKIWFQNRRSKVKKLTKHGVGSAAHSTMTDADCSVSGTDELASSDDEPDEDHRDVDEPPETRDSSEIPATATPPTDQCISPPTAQHNYIPTNLPPSQIVPSSSSSSSNYFMPPPVVPDWTDFPPPPVGVIPPAAYPDYFYPSAAAAAAMAGYHASAGTASVGVPNCPPSAGPYHHWYATGQSQHSLLA